MEGLVSKYALAGRLRGTYLKGRGLLEDGSWKLNCTEGGVKVKNRDGRESNKYIAGKMEDRT